MKLIKIFNDYFNADTLLNFCCVDDAIYLNFKCCGYRTEGGDFRHSVGYTSFAKCCLVGNDTNVLNAIFQRFVDFLIGNNDEVFVFNCENYPFEKYEPYVEPVNSSQSYECRRKWEERNKERNKRYEDIKRKYGYPTLLCKIKN